MRESQGGRNRIMVLQHKEQPCCSCYLTSAANSLDPPRSLAKGENSHQVSFSLPWGGLFLREKRNSAGKGTHQTLALKSWQIQSWHWRADLYYEFSKSIHNSNRKSTGINAYRLKKKKSAAIRIYQSHCIKNHWISSKRQNRGWTCQTLKAAYGKFDIVGVKAAFWAMSVLRPAPKCGRRQGNTTTVKLVLKPTQFLLPCAPEHGPGRKKRSSPLPPPSWLLSCLLDISSQCPFGVCVWWWWWLLLELHCAPRLCLQLWSHFILPSLPGKSPQLSSIWCQDLNLYLQADFLLEGQQLLGHQFPDNPQVPRVPSDQNCPLIITPGSFKADPSSLF